MSVNVSGSQTRVTQISRRALPSITVTQVLRRPKDHRDQSITNYQLPIITATHPRIIGKLLSSPPTHFLSFVHLLLVVLTGSDWVLVMRTMPMLMARMPMLMLMPVVRPPAGTPRASCQLTLLTSPARVTRVGHSGEENCKLEISSML